MARIKNNQFKIMFFALFIFSLMGWWNDNTINSYVYLSAAGLFFMFFIGMLFNKREQIQIRNLFWYFGIVFIVIGTLKSYFNVITNTNNQLAQQLNENKHQLITMQNRSKATYIQLNKEKDLGKKYNLQIKFNQEQSNINSKQKEIKELKEKSNEN